MKKYINSATSETTLFDELGIKQDIEDIAIDNGFIFKPTGYITGLLRGQFEDVDIEITYYDINNHKISFQFSVNTKIEDFKVFTSEPTFMNTLNEIFDTYKEDLQFLQDIADLKI